MVPNFIANQLRKPEGFWGKIVARKMTERNTPMYEEAVGIMGIREGDTLLEVGFGPGIMMNMILRGNPGVAMKGIDFSKLMLEQCTGLNREFIESGRLELIHGDFMDPRFRF